jgi:hypothetical protein
MGEVFVKYLEPIHVKSWLENEGITDVKNETREIASFKLTTELYVRQQ